MGSKHECGVAGSVAAGHGSDAARVEGVEAGTGFLPGAAEVVGGSADAILERSRSGGDGLAAFSGRDAYFRCDRRPKSWFACAQSHKSVVLRLTYNVRRYRLR